ncbi:MAG: Amuc_1099 family pilus-like system protein [Pseudomonadota bacterium]
MSATPRHGHSWISQNYDKMILIVILVGLLLSALFLVIQIGRVRQVLTEAKWEKPAAEPKMAQALNLEQFDATRAAFTSPFQIAPYTNRMSTSELRVSCVQCQKPIPINAVKCPFCSAEQPTGPVGPVDSDGDGIPDVYESEHGMNPLDHDDAVLDLDNDGFSNLEEYQFGSNPNDVNDFPSPAAKLRLVKIGSNPFKLRFQGDAKMPGGKVLYQLNLRSLERTYFSKIGDELEGGFKVLEYLPKDPEGPVIVLQQGSNQVRLVKGKAIQQYEMVAGLVFLIDRTTLRARIGDTIQLKDREYKVIDIKRDGVLIRDVKTNKDTLVGPLSESERMALSGGMENLPQANPGIPGAPVLQ